MFNDDIKLIKKVIDKFEAHLVSKNDLSSNPFNYVGKTIPMKGEEFINDVIYKFRYHGGGCEIIWENYIIDYNIVPFLEQTYKPKISCFKFYRYLVSKDINTNLSLDYIYLELFNLQKLNLLKEIKNIKGVFEIL
ncbi:hypothetical protein GCM10027035_06970 [Emticicia sediminis]